MASVAKFDDAGTCHRLAWATAAAAFGQGLAPSGPPAKPPNTPYIDDFTNASSQHSCLLRRNLNIAF